MKLWNLPLSFIHNSPLSESRAIAEWWQLQWDPVYQGTGLPKGNGETVIVLPGLFGNDLYLQPLCGWLRRLGYRPRGSRLLINAGCPERLADSVFKSLAAELRHQTDPVAIIGHSRGGMLGKALLARLNQPTSHFITLGSPLGAMLQWLSQPDGGDGGTAQANRMANSATVGAAQAAMRLLDPDCNAPACGCAYIQGLQARFPSNTKVTAIYSSQDPIVAPSACPIVGADNIEVRGSHSGLVANVAVYRHIATALQR